MEAKIEKVEVFILRVPLGPDRFWSSQSAFPERNSLLVKVSSGKKCGWGEAGHYGPPEPVAAAIQHVLAPRIIGLAVQPRVVSEGLYCFSRDFGQRGTYVEAISGIDVALWDLLGHLLDAPVCKLLGGSFRDQVKVYASACCYRHNSEDPSTIDVEQSVRDAAEEAASLKSEGFKAMKMFVGLLPIRQDLQRVSAVREAIGPEMGLMVDSNHAYSLPTAICFASALEKYDVRWLEEPLVPEDLQGYQDLRSKTKVAVSGGEGSFMRFGFRDLLSNPRGPCVDIAQPDISACGGLSEFVRIVALASSFGVPVVPHVWGSAVALAAALHAVATLPLTPFTANPVFLENEPMIEFDRNQNPLRDELLIDHKWTVSDAGTLEVPMKRPGLGIEVDESLVAKFHVPLDWNQGS